MEINKKTDGEVLTVALTGRLDTISSPQLEESLKEELDGVRVLMFDLAGLSYISSAGLRVLLSMQKRMNRQGEMIVKNVEPVIMEVFEMTGFLGVLKVR